MLWMEDKKGKTLPTKPADTERPDGANEVGRSDDSASSDPPVYDIPPQFLHEIPEEPPIEPPSKEAYARLRRALRSRPLTPADAYNRQQWRDYWYIQNIRGVIGFIWLVAIVVGIIIIYF